MAQERGIGEIRSPFIDFRRPPELDLSVEEQYFVGDVNWLPECRLYNERIEIDDPVWGYEEIGDQKHDYVLIELAKNQALTRLNDIEQLTLPRNYTTIPNTSLFSRWEHVWGSVILARKIIRRNNDMHPEGSEGHIDPETALKMQIRTLLSDAGHTSGSHLGDWLFQEGSDQEDLHDINLKAYLERSGVNGILRKYNIDPAEVIFPDVQDWIECDAPALCVDRVDYSLREMRRWMGNETLNSITDEDFRLTEDGRIYMTDPGKAKLFAEAYLILSKEHWNDPVHRLQLELFKIRFQRVLATTTGKSGIHPLAQMLGTDQDFALAMKQKGGFESTLDTTLEDIGRFERTLGWSLRRDRVARMLELGDHESGEVGLRDAVPHYPMVAVETTEEYVEDDSCIKFELPHLKFRQIDPLLLIDGSLVNLSQVEEGLTERLESNRRFVLTDYVGKLAVPNLRLREYILGELKTLEEEWAEVRRAYEVTPGTLDRQVFEAIRLAG